MPLCTRERFWKGFVFHYGEDKNTVPDFENKIAETCSEMVSQHPEQKISLKWLQLDEINSIKKRSHFSFSKSTVSNLKTHCTLVEAVPRSEAETVRLPAASAGWHDADVRCCANNSFEWNPLRLASCSWRVKSSISQLQFLVLTW